jgi:peroxiredoxin
MNLMIFGLVLPWLFLALLIVLGCWLSFQLIHQNGRILSHLQTLEQRPGPGRDGSMPAALPLPAIAAGAAPELALPDPIYGRLLMRLESLEQRLAQQAPPPAPAPGAPAGLPLGSPAPAFELPDLDGRRRSLAQFRGQRLLLLFFNPGCGFCTRMAADLAALPIDGAGGRPLPLVISTGGVDANRKLIEEHGIRCPVLLQEGMEVGGRYQANGTPMGYLIDEQGNIASELAVGGPAVLDLATRPNAAANGSAPAPANGNGHAALGGKRPVEESKIQRHGLPAGTAAPDFRLPLLHGGELALSEYRGREVLLVFSDPNCGPCDQLAPRLEQLARRTPGVQVLMVTRGEEAANRAKTARHGLTFPVVLQRQWEISREYGMFATPVGYRIDAQGIIAGEAAVGVEPILALFGSPEPPAAAPANGKRCRCGKPIGECGCEKANERAGRDRHSSRR